MSPPSWLWQGTVVLQVLSVAGLWIAFWNIRQVLKSDQQTNKSLLAALQTAVAIIEQQQGFLKERDARLRRLGDGTPE